MRKPILALLFTILILSAVLPVNASIVINSTIDDSLFTTYEFKNLDQTIYEQAFAQLNAETIPKAIVDNLKRTGVTQVGYGLPPQPLAFDNTTRTISASFYLSGTDIISYTVNTTTMKRTYQIRTEWRKLQLNLTTDYSIDFTQSLANPVESWQKINTTDLQGAIHPTYYYENKQTDTLDTFFYLVLPASASGIQVQGNLISYEMPPTLGDQLLNSPFTILAALAVALAIILLFRKIR